MLRALLPLLVLLLGVTGCSTPIGEFTVLSTHNVEISRIDLKKIDMGHNTGESTRFWILFVPIGREPSINEATDRCIDHGRGDFIMNARVFDNSWTCLLFSWGSYVVRGEVGLSTRGGSREIHEPAIEACPPAAAPAPQAPQTPRAPQPGH